MNPSKVLVGQVLVVLLVVSSGMTVATQWTAAALGFQPRLGSPWFVADARPFFDAVPIYYPWRLFEWWYAYEAYAPSTFQTGGLIAAAGGLCGASAAIIGSLWRARQSRLVTTYGSARWADQRDIADAQLLRGAGVFLSRYDEHYLRHEGPEHVMAFAPTRSGKGVGLVVPTLLSWPASVIVHDIKGENWQLTAGWRSRFSHCLREELKDTHLLAQGRERTACLL
jgi:type IV secretion system protein VirD4